MILAGWLTDRLQSCDGQQFMRDRSGVSANSDALMLPNSFRAGDLLYRQVVQAFSCRLQRNPALTLSVAEPELWLQEIGKNLSL